MSCAASDTMLNVQGFKKNRIRAAVQTDDLDLLRDLLTRHRSYSHEDLSAALCLAAELGRDQCVEVLLHHNALPNVHDGSGFTPLIIAAKFGNCGVLRLLISAKCNLNKPTFRVRATALHWAATNGYLACVESLLAAGCVVDVQTTHGRTPLMLAARSDQPEIVTALLRAGASVNKADVDNTTALHLAAEEGSLECVKELLAAGALCNTHSKTGNTALLLAAKRGHTSVLLELLKLSDIEVTSHSHGLSILHWTAHGGHSICLQHLLTSKYSHQLNINEQTYENYFGPQMIINEGMTPLMLACSGEHKECVDILLKHGAKTELIDIEGMTALLYAVRNDSSQCVYSLLRHGADPNHVSLPQPIRDPEFDDIAEEDEDDNEQSEHVSNDVNLSNEYRLSPLFYAIQKDCRASFMALLHGNCKLDQYYVHKNGEFLQPLELALCCGHYKIVQMLLQLGHVNNINLSDTVQHALAILMQRDEALFTHVMEHVSAPPSLSSQCRWLIRRLLGSRLLCSTCDLPLPTSLINYVNLSDLEAADL